MLLLIHLEETNDGWIASMRLNRQVWEFGKTKEEAVFKLIVTLQMID